ncbi:class I SAM-dependent methyltransferase [Aliikangiella marina]|nr:class I SAM-dependent methyltransferase [Aliikangiella marina]
MSKQDIWSSYWMSDNTAIVDTDSKFKELLRYWEFKFNEVQDGHNLLEVGTGNGRLVEVFKQFAKNANLTAVDGAKIDKENDAFKSTAQTTVKVIAEQPIETLSENENYDFIFSQFTIEYTDIEKTISKLTSVLSPGGKLTLICHEVGSILYNSAQAEVNEIDWLKNEINLFTYVHKQIELKHQRLASPSPSLYSEYKKHNRNYNDLIKKLHKYFEETKSAFFAVNLVDVIYHTIENMDHLPFEEVKQKIEELELQVNMHQARLNALLENALTTEKLTQISDLIATDLTITKSDLIYRDEDGQIIARVVEASKA